MTVSQPLYSVSGAKRSPCRATSRRGAAPWLYAITAAAALVAPPTRASGQPDLSAGPQLSPLPIASETDYSDSLAADPAAAPPEADASLEDRLNTLEKKYDQLDEDYQQLNDDYGALQDDVKRAAVSGHSGSALTVFGRIHVDHWAFPGDSPGINAFETGDPTVSPQDRLELRRLRFGVQGDVWENMEYRIEMEFSGGNDPEFRDAYLGFNDLPALQTLLIGNQKRPYGLDHINSSRYNIFLERPFIVEALNQDNRRLGVQSYGFSEDLAWNWRYGVFNQRLIQDEGRYISDHYQPELAGRVANTFFYDEACDGRDYGHWAIAGSIANPDGSGLPGRATNEARFRTRAEVRSDSRWLDTGVIDNADDYGLLALENVWNFGPLQLVGEYQSLWLDRGAPTDLNFHGGYFYAAYVLTGEHVPWDRETGQLGRLEPLANFYPFTTCVDDQRTGWGAWQVAYRMSYGDLSDEDILGGVGHSHTLGLVWYWNPWAKMVFNTVYGEIDDHEPVAGQTFGHYTAVGTRFMIDF